MDKDLLNELLSYLGVEAIAEREHFDSGQRKVFFGKSTPDQSEIVIKYCLYSETKIARIQREIAILGRFASEYFPRVLSHLYVTSEAISEIIDSLDVDTQMDQIVLLRTSNIKPFFISIENFIPNVSWESYLDGPTKVEKLLSILDHTFVALSMLWSEKIIHRDLKPLNILIRSNNMPVIIDLGTAKSLEAGATNITKPFFPAPCTPSYAAPEQLRLDGDVDLRADQFSMGVIIFEALTHQFPYGNYEDIGLEDLQKNFAAGIPLNIEALNPEVKPDFAKFINKLLSIEPYKRFRNGEAILEELRKIRGLQE